MVYTTVVAADRDYVLDTNIVNDILACGRSLAGQTYREVKRSLRFEILRRNSNRRTKIVNQNRPALGNETCLPKMISDQNIAVRTTVFAADTLPLCGHGTSV